MNVLAMTTFSIPIVQIIFYMFFSTICFLFKKDRLGLIVSFVFVFNWGFLYSSSSFVDMMGNLNYGLFVFLFSGFLMITLAVVGFLQEERSLADTVKSNSRPSRPDPIICTTY